MKLSRWKRRSLVPLLLAALALPTLAEGDAVLASSAERARERALSSAHPPAPDGARSLPSGPPAPGEGGYGLSSAQAAGADDVAAAADREAAAGRGDVAARGGPVSETGGHEGVRGEASWYGPGLHGRRTANGERFDRMALTAAHRTLPFGTLVRVEHVHSGRSVEVRINDRGPHGFRNRIIDLSEAAARAIGLGRGRGVAPVRITILKQPRR